jgi:hypothetical protein
VAGRLALHEIAGHAGIPERQTDGTWLYSAGPWRLRSRPENVFETAGEALRMLLVNAYRHKEMERIISPNRCLALTSADGKSRRLWEICRTEKTLGDALTSTLHGTQSILVLASETVEIASFLVQAAHIFKNQKIPLPPHLSHIGKIADQPVYLGFLPAAETDQQADSKIDVSQLIRSQFYRPVKQALSEKNIKIPLLLRAMQQLKNHGDAEPAIVDTLSALFIGE